MSFVGKILNQYYASLCEIQRMKLKYIIYAEVRWGDL